MLVVNDVVNVMAVISACVQACGTRYSTNNTKQSKYKYTYYQNTHTLQNKLKQPQDKLKIN